MGLPASSSTGQHALDYSSNQSGHLGDRRKPAAKPNRPNAKVNPAGRTALKNRKEGERLQQRPLYGDEKGFSSDEPKKGQPAASMQNISAAEQKGRAELIAIDGVVP